jgi:Flp pilus assembly protein TadD
MRIPTIRFSFCLVSLLAIPSFAQQGAIRWTGSTVTLHELAHRVPARASKEFAAGMKAIRAGKQQDAILHLQKAISIDPEFLCAINNLGVIYFRSDHADLALEQLQRAAAVDPRSAAVHFNLALVYFTGRDFQSGERSVREFLDINGPDTRAMLLLGMSLMLQHRFTADAESNLQRAAADFPFARLWLGTLLLDKGDIQAARDQLTAYLRSGDTGQDALHAAEVLRQKIELAARTRMESQRADAVRTPPPEN